MDFIFVKLLFNLILKNDVSDTFALFRLRSSFGEAFKSAVCRNGGTCESCGYDSECPYRLTFSQALSQDDSAVKRHQKPSLPFVFDVPPLPFMLNRGGRIEVGLTLAGTAINHLSHYINALEILFNGSTGTGQIQANIDAIESLTCTDYRNRIGGRGEKPALDAVSTISLQDLLEMKTLDPNRIGIIITSPMRLMKEGRPVKELAFSSLIRPLLRRISSLAFYYCGNRFEADFRLLSAAADSIVLVENGFRWEEWGEEGASDRPGGIVGKGVFEGQITDFHPFLLLGEYFHVGKGSPFGFGGYRTA